MNDIQKVFAGLFAFCCIAEIYCVSFAILHPFEFPGIETVITIGYFDMVFVECYYIVNYLEELRELLEREAEKKWIDKALEGGI